MMTRSIVFITPAYAPHKGGVETHVAAVAAVLLRRGYQVQVITLADDAELSPRSVVGGVQVHRMKLAPELLKQPRSWKYKRAIWSAMQTYRALLEPASVIHVHDVWWWLWPQWWHYRPKLFITFHGWEGQYPVRIAAKIQRLVANWLTRGSIHVGGWIQEFYWDKPSLVTYGGVNPAITESGKATVQAGSEHETRQSLGTRSSLRLQELHFVFVGRLEPENEIDNYIRLVTELRAQNKNVTMTWVGDGSLRSDCEKVGKVTGMVDDLRPWLETADIVGANSYLSMLTAQALGKIVCALFSLRLKQRYLETYPGAQFMLIANSYALMAQQIVEILNNLSRQADLAQQAQTFAKTQTWERVATDYEQLWFREDKTQNKPGRKLS